MRFLSLFLVALLVAACSSKGSDTSSGGASSSGGSSSGNASSSSGSSGTPDVPLAPPSNGMQLATTSIKVANGAEQYSCWSFKVPDGAPISLIGLDNQVPTKGIHHWAVFTNSDPIKDPGPYECATMGIAWGLVSGGGLGTPGVKFPDGVAMNLPAGQHIIFQLHLLNASGADIEVAPAYINLNGTTATGLQPVGLLIAGTLNIQIPAHQTDVTVTGGCKLTDPLPHIFSVFPHMHQLGKRISAAVQPAAGAGVTIAHVPHATAPHASDYLQFFLAARPRLGQIGRFRWRNDVAIVDNEDGRWMGFQRRF